MKKTRRLRIICVILLAVILIVSSLFILLPRRNDGSTGRAALMFVHEDEDILLITDDGTIIRARAADVRLCGRSTQGVRIMRLAEGSTVVGVCRAEKEEEAPEELPEGTEAPETAAEGGENPAAAEAAPATETPADEEKPVKHIKAANNIKIIPPWTMMICAVRQKVHVLMGERRYHDEQHLYERRCKQYEHFNNIRASARCGHCNQKDTVKRCL